MRLIDADKIKEEVALMWGDNSHITESVCEIIDHIPTVDNKEDECWAGFWDFNGYTHYCSCCGKDAEVNENGEEILDDYCPHCKAEMVEQ